VRGLLANHRIDPPTLNKRLYIAQVLSNLSGHKLKHLNFGGVLKRLKETIQELPYVFKLECTSLTIREHVRQLVANQLHRIVHYMGPGGQDEKEESTLYFEQNNGDLYRIRAKDFLRRVPETIFLVTLKARVSSAPRSTTFSNLATTLIHLKMANDLGMCFSIPGDNARSFPQLLYSKQAKSISLEETVFQARLALTKNSLSWAFHISELTNALFITLWPRFRFHQYYTHSCNQRELGPPRSSDDRRLYE
jgi:hypothetical protein